MATTRRDAQIQKAVDAAVAEARKGLVTAESKPDLVAHLRKSWRKSGQHVAEQAKRFLRLFVVSAIPALSSLLMSGSHFDRATLLALLVPVAETAYRQVFPALGAQAADDAPGVTIVPDQVGVPTVAVPVSAEVDVALPEGDAAP